MKKLMKGAVLGTLASVLLLSGCSNEQAAPANEEKRVCTVDNGGVEGLDMTVTATGNGISVYNSGRVVCTAVVDNDDFDLFQGLTDNRVEAFPYILFYIVHRYDDRYTGLHI